MGRPPGADTSQEAGDGLSGAQPHLQRYQLPPQGEPGPALGQTDRRHLHPVTPMSYNKDVMG